MKLKLENMLELESNRATKEENKRLRKEMDALREKAGTNRKNRITHKPSLSSPARDIDEELHEMKATVDALEKVTASQAKSLNALRAKAQQRRDELQQKDLKISELSQTVRCLQQAMDMGGLGGSGCETELRLQLLEMQRCFHEKECEVAALQNQLEESQTALEKLSCPPGEESCTKMNRHNSSRSVGSTESLDSFMVRNQLAEASNRITELERELEAAREMIHDSHRSQEGIAQVRPTSYRTCTSRAAYAELRTPRVVRPVVGYRDG